MQTERQARCATIYANCFDDGLLVCTMQGVKAAQVFLRRYHASVWNSRMLSPEQLAQCEGYMDGLTEGIGRGGWGKDWILGGPGR